MNKASHRWSKLWNSLDSSISTDDQLMSIIAETNSNGNRPWPSSESSTSSWHCDTGEGAPPWELQWFQQWQMPVLVRRNQQEGPFNLVTANTLMTWTWNNTTWIKPTEASQATLDILGCMVIIVQKAPQPLQHGPTLQHEGVALVPLALLLAMISVIQLPAH